MPTQNLKEFGLSGLMRTGRAGQSEIFEESLPELRGERGRRIYKQMAEGDATCGALLFAIEMLCRQVDFSFNAASDKSEHKEIADFYSGALFTDMSQTWPDLLSEILTCLTYGWSFNEIVYKLRQGPNRDERRNSRFNDGRIGWRKWGPRAQETLFAWEYDEDGSLLGMTQVPPPDFISRTIPIEKALLFRTSTRKGNPEGQSIFRKAYFPWYYKTNIERIEGIGIERDLAGLPVAYVPPEIMGSNASADDRAIFEIIKQIVVNIRRDEQEGVVMPLMYDAAGKEMYRLELLTSGGQRQFDTDKVITRKDQRILMTVMADFLLLGHEKVGSFALSDSKTNLFAVALGGWLDSFCEVINRYAVPRLGKLNAIPQDAWPQLTHGDIEEISMADLASYVETLSRAGFNFQTPEVKTKLFERARLPVPTGGFTQKDIDSDKAERQAAAGVVIPEPDDSEDPEDENQ